MQVKDLLVVLLVGAYFLYMRKPSEFVWLTDILMLLATILLIVKYFVMFKSKK